MFPKSTEIERVEWSPSGSVYAVVVGAQLQLYNANQVGDSKFFFVSCLVYCRMSWNVAGGETKAIRDA